MIYIPWKDELCVSACCQFDGYDINPREIAEHGFLCIWENRLMVFLMNKHPDAPDLVNDIIAFDFDRLGYRCDHTPTYIDKYIVSAHKMGGKLWNGRWVPLTGDYLFQSSDSARDIARSLIGYITGHLDMETCLHIISREGNLPPATYHWDESQFFLRCRGKTITLEDYLSLMYP